MLEHKVLLPGWTTLEKLVTTVRTEAADRLWAGIADRADLELRIRLSALLEVEPESRFSSLERLRTAPARVSGPELERALKASG